MKFKHPGPMEPEFLLRIEPELRVALLDFDTTSLRVHWPDPLFTCFGRNEAENKAVGGVPTSLHLWKPNELGVLVSAAADMSIWPYTPEQLDEVEFWWRAYLAQRGGVRSHSRPDARWEFLIHDVGNGRHIHVGLRRLPKEK